MRYHQDLQVALRERLRRLATADFHSAAYEMTLVVDWIEAQPALRAALDEADLAEPGLDRDAFTAQFEQGLTPGQLFQWPSRTEAGRASLCRHLVRRFAAATHGPLPGYQLVYQYGARFTTDSDEVWGAFVQRIVRPLIDYLTEQVGAESSVLYVLERYVRRVEWFDRESLHQRAEAEPRKAEKIYDTDLRRFLFGEGVNMPFTQAQSASGLSDLVSELDSDDPLVAEVKIFDNADRGRRHLASGVNQAVQYAGDYGKTVAYLIIINLSGRSLSLPTENTEKAWPPYITVAGVRVYLIAVRALPVAGASKQGKPSPIMIRRGDLVDPDAVENPQD